MSNRVLAVAAATAVVAALTAAADASATALPTATGNGHLTGTEDEPPAEVISVSAEWPAHCLDDVPSGPQDYQEAFDHRSSGWAGADGAWPIVLPDERVLWLFGDSLIGEIDEDDALQPGWRMVISMQVQDGACFTPLTGGTIERPESILPNEDGLLHWAGGGYVDTSGAEPVVRVAAVGVVPGTLGEPEANRIFTLSLPDLELIGIDDMPHDVIAGDPNFASNLLHDGDTVYFVGRRVGAAEPNLARVEADDPVDGAYEYWTGDGWSADVDDAGPIEVDEPGDVSDLAMGRIIPWGDGYLMTGKMGYLWVFTDELYAWYADEPSGPWSVVRNDAGEPRDIGEHPGFPQGRWIYGGYLTTDVPGASPEEPILIFSTNGLGCSDDDTPCTPDNDIQQNVMLYGPHFLRPVGLPAPPDGGHGRCDAALLESG